MIYCKFALQPIVSYFFTLWYTCCRRSGGQGQRSPPQERAYGIPYLEKYPGPHLTAGLWLYALPHTPEGKIDEPRAEALLNAAREAGVNYFDTAYPYHGGESEPFVGRVIAKWPRESFYLATKLPLWQCKSLDDAKRIFAEQQKRLGVDYFDFYLMHSLHKARYDEAKALGIETDTPEQLARYKEEWSR